MDVLVDGLITFWSLLWRNPRYGPNSVIAKEVKSSTCFVRFTTLIVQVGEMPWLQTGTTHFHGQFGLQDRGCAI